MPRVTIDSIETKVDLGKGTFQFYGNTKGIIDRIGDRTIDGCFQNGINHHRQKGTMPSMFWMHDSFSLPVSKMTHIEEDSTGLFCEGKEIKGLPMSEQILICAHEGLINKYSMGYSVQKEKYNQSDHCNDLIEVFIKEVSWVNDMHACNQEANLLAIKSALEGGQVLSKAQLRELLKDHGVLSKNQIEAVTSRYDPAKFEQKAVGGVISQIENLPLFNK